MPHITSLTDYFGDDRPVQVEENTQEGRWPLQSATQLWEQADTAICAFLKRLRGIEGVEIEASFSKENGGAPNKETSYCKLSFGSDDTKSYRMMVSGCNARSQHNIFAFEEYKLFEPVNLMGSIDDLLRAESDPAAVDVTSHKLSDFVGALAKLTKTHYPEQTNEIDDVARDFLAEKPPQTGIVQQRIEPTL